MNVLRWLLDSDPAIRWQALRDLTEASEAEIAAERARVPDVGWGEKLLAQQAPGGYWGGPQDEGWMTSIYALVMLENFGLDPKSERARIAIERVSNGLMWYQLDGRRFFEGETEPCLNGAILSVGSYFGVASEHLVDRLLAEQLEDGGWNCEAPKSTRSSFHTTICVLEGLLAYERVSGGTPQLRAARIRGQDYLLARRMLRSLRTGELIDRRWQRFAFPPTWRYDVLRGLDYLRSAGFQPDDRIGEALCVVLARRHRNGRWPLNTIHSGRLDFVMESGTVKPSYWNSLRALRVLKWARRSHRALDFDLVEVER